MIWLDFCFCPYFYGFFDFHQAVKITEHEVGTLVGGKAAGKADGQDVRVVGVREFEYSVQVGLGALVAGMLLGQAVAAG